MNLKLGRRLLPERLQNVDGTTVSEILACGLRLLYNIVQRSQLTLYEDLLEFFQVSGELSR